MNSSAVTRSILTILLQVTKLESADLVSGTDPVRSTNPGKVMTRSRFSSRDAGVLPHPHKYAAKNWKWVGWRSGWTYLGSRHGRSGVRFPGRSNRTQCRQRLATAAMFLRSCVVQALSRGDGSRHLLHASAWYREYNEDLIYWEIRSQPFHLQRSKYYRTKFYQSYFLCICVGQKTWPQNYLFKQEINC